MLPKSFFLAGKAQFNISSKTGKSYSYQVVRKEANGNYKETFFVSCQVGEGSWVYLGVLNPQNGHVILTARSKFVPESNPVKGVRWAMQIVWNGRKLSPGNSIEPIGSCPRCGERDVNSSGFCSDCVGMEEKPLPVDSHVPVEVKDTIKASYFLSDGDCPSVRGLSAHYDGERDLLYWDGWRDGKWITIFND